MSKSSKDQRIGVGDAGLPSEEIAGKYSESRLRCRVVDAVAHWVEKGNEVARRRNGRRIKMPTVLFDLRGRTAGIAITSPATGTSTIRINLDLLRRYPREMIQNTVPHEVAHVVTGIAWSGCNVDSHGKEWQSVMRAFGKEPTRCHTMHTVPARKLKRYSYVCQCPGKVFELTSVRHNRIVKGRGYGCPVCHATLRRLQSQNS